MTTLIVTLKCNTPDVVALWWKALSELPCGPVFPEDDKGAGQRYDRALLALGRAGFTPSVAEEYIA